MRQVSFSDRAPHFPPFTQRGPTYSISLQALSQVHPFSDAEWRAVLPRNPSRYCRRAMSRSLSLCFDQVEFHLAVPTAGGARSLARSFPSSFPNRNQQPLNRSSYEKHAQQKGGKERRRRGTEERGGERSILTPPTEADDRFLFARLNKFPVSVR